MTPAPEPAPMAPLRQRAAAAAATTRQWFRDHRGWRYALWGLAGFYALYLLAANVFLNTAIGEHTINRRPDGFHASWDWAASLYPGHVHARGVAMGGLARKTSWKATADRADGRIRILPLFGRTLRFAPIDAEAVAVDIRRADTERVPPVSKSKSPPWTLDFEAITTRTLQSLSFYGLAVEGGGEASFATTKVLRGGAMSIAPSRLAMPAARFSYGDILLAEDARLDLDLSMAPNTTEQARGIAKMRYIDAQLALDGRTTGLVVAGDADGRLQTRRGGGEGRIGADLALAKGEFAKGGSVRAELPVDVRTTDQPQRYAATLAIDVLDDALSVHALVPPVAEGGNRIDAQLRMGGRSLDPAQLESQLRAASGSVDLRWHFPTLRWLNPMLSHEQWLRLDGAVDAEASLQLQDGRLLPGSRVALPAAQLDVALFDTLISGLASAEAEVGEDGVALAMTADEFRVAGDDAPDRPYVLGSGLRLDATSSRDLHEFRDRLRARLRFEDARIPDLRAYNRYLPGGSLRLDGGSGSLSGDFTVAASGEVEAGQVRLRGRDARIALGPTRISGNLALDSRLRALDGSLRRYALDDTTIDLRNIRVAAGDPPWWGTVRLDRATLDWQRRFGLDGNVRLAMQDASVLLALYAERRAFPGWIGRLVDEGQVAANGRVQVRGDTVVLDRVEANNDRFGLRARMRIADGSPRGDLYASWRRLGVGVELQGDSHRMHLRGAREWYEGRPPLLSAAAPR